MTDREQTRRDARRDWWLLQQQLHAPHPLSESQGPLGRMYRRFDALLSELEGLVWALRGIADYGTERQKALTARDALTAYEAAGVIDLTLLCPTCGERADMCFDHGDDWKKR